MTPDEIQLVVQTVERLRPRLPELAMAFYDRLFAEHPDLRVMFPTDLTALRGKFADELDTIVTAIPDLDRFLNRAGHLGARHVEYGVRAGHYPMVGRALVAMLAERMGPHWSDEHEAAWASAYSLVSEAMLMGASPTVPMR